MLSLYVLVSLSSNSVEQRLIDHTLKAVEGRDSTIASLIAKFNKKVGEQEDLIRKGKAPPNAKAMTRLPTKGIFDVDVDSEIWLPLRARIHDDSGSPPPWLADENVRKGIQAMLTLQRCKEEEKRLQHETRNLRTWFSMEWKSLQKTCDVLRNSEYVVTLFACSHSLSRPCDVT